MTLLHTTAPYWDVWSVWFLSDLVGIVVVAPVVIELGQIWREPPSQGEWIEGVAVVTLLALARLSHIRRVHDGYRRYNYGIGHYGDAAIPVMARVRAAQAAVGTGTIFSLFLIALFNQRKKAEEGLQHREAELAEAQRVARIGSWHWHSQSDVLVGSDELFRIYGFDPTTPPANYRREF